MLDCDECHGWFHGACVGVTPDMTSKSTEFTFVCDCCRVRREILKLRRQFKAIAAESALRAAVAAKAKTAAVGDGDADGVVGSPKAGSGGKKGRKSGKGKAADVDAVEAAKAEEVLVTPKAKDSKRKSGKGGSSTKKSSKRAKVDDEPCVDCAVAMVLANRCC